jgi:hypothetical protein
LLLLTLCSISAGSQQDSVACGRVACCGCQQVSFAALLSGM